MKWKPRKKQPDRTYCFCPWHAETGRLDSLLSLRGKTPLKHLAVQQEPDQHFANWPVRKALGCWCPSVHSLLSALWYLSIKQHVLFFNKPPCPVSTSLLLWTLSTDRHRQVSTGVCVAGLNSLAADATVFINAAQRRAVYSPVLRRERLAVKPAGDCTPVARKGCCVYCTRVFRLDRR